MTGVGRASPNRVFFWADSNCISTPTPRLPAMTASPLLTAIIPTYNWSSVLPYSIGSVLGQTFADFELLVIGDGCTDGSEAVVEAIGDSRVRWINLPANTGHQAGPNNEGLRQARGQFIAYLGHDDLWLPNHLDCLVSALVAGADVAYAMTELIGPEGSYSELVPLKPYQPGAWLPPSCVAHRRSVTDHVGGWRHFRELDTDPERELWGRAHKGGHQFTFVPRLTAVKFPALWRRGVYRQRPSHEQAAWFARIQNESDFEAVELSKMRAATNGFLLERIKRVWRRVSIRSPILRPLRRGKLNDLRRRFKGLDRDPGEC
jgi:glycosyltransferase involved in cell wall biosynthesis